MKGRGSEYGENRLCLGYQLLELQVPYAGDPLACFEEPEELLYRRKQASVSQKLSKHCLEAATDYCPTITTRRPGCGWGIFWGASFV